MKKKRLLVTSALPYANGSIHIGHLMEHIQTDIWVRSHRLSGHEVRYFCADDTHGTPVMIAARERGMTPEALITESRDEHHRDLLTFGIEFDEYYTTNSPENRELSEAIYNQSRKHGHVFRKAVRQFHCERDAMFLPDRFIKGVCPSCATDDQYGDACEKCGATYSPQDLKNPRCALCGEGPKEKESDHIFFKLGDFRDRLKEWIASPGRAAGRSGWTATCGTRTSAATARISDS